jgi:hypothetical protein
VAQERQDKETMEVLAHIVVLHMVEEVVEVRVLQVQMEQAVLVVMVVRV